MKYIFILLLFPAAANADNTSMFKKIYEACSKDKNIGLCVSTQRTVKKIEKSADRVLNNLGIKDIAGVTAATTKILLEKRAEVKIGKIAWINNDSSVLQINKERVLWQIKWSIP